MVVTLKNPSVKSDRFIELTCFYPKSSVMTHLGRETTNLSENKMKNLIFFLFTTISGTALSSSYEDMSRCAKFQYLWQKQILTSEYKQLPALTGSYSDLISGLGGALGLGQTFDRTSDAFESPKKKLLHPFGSTVGLRFEMVQQALPGLLGDHHKCVLARFSLAGDPKALGFTPGLALKFFVDGSPSRNIMVMNSLDGQGRDENFFARSFSNSLQPPSSFMLKIIERGFALVKKNPRFLSIDHLLSVDKYGRTAGNSRSAPMQIILRPTASLSADSRLDFRAKFQSIPKGTVLYEVFVRTADSKPVKIGNLRTITRFVSSSFGDNRLFFKHQR